MSLLSDAEAAVLESDTKAALNRALRAVSKEKHRTERIVEVIYQAVADNLKALELVAVPAPKADRRRGDGLLDGVLQGDDETAIIAFSDLQLGQVTASYNSEVAEQRVQLYADKIARLTELQRASHPIRRAKLYMLGDLIEGELIVPSHPHQVDSSVYAQVALNGPRILTGFIRRLLEIFDSVDVVSVPGNHGDVGGASRKQYNPETNFDRMLSTIVRQIFDSAGEQRITWTIPDGYGQSSWYAVDYIGDIGFQMWHGHQARRTSSSSHLPFYKLVLGWQAGAIPERFTYSLCGHHHTPTYLTIGHGALLINGTFASDSEYAVERLASNSRPAQWLLFASPTRGVTASYLVTLDD